MCKTLLYRFKPYLYKDPPQGADSAWKVVLLEFEGVPTYGEFVKDL